MPSDFLPISKAAKYLNVSSDTLRRWEKEGKIQATRTPGGIRLFSQDQLDVIRYPNVLKAKDAAAYLHLSPSTIRRLSDSGVLPSTKDAQGNRIFQLQDLKKFNQPQNNLQSSPIAYSPVESETRQDERLTGPNDNSQTLFTVGEDEKTSHVGLQPHSKKSSDFYRSIRQLTERTFTANKSPRAFFSRSTIIITGLIILIVLLSSLYISNKNQNKSEQYSLVEIQQTVSEPAVLGYADSVQQASSKLNQFINSAKYVVGELIQSVSASLLSFFEKNADDQPTGPALSYTSSAKTKGPTGNTGSRGLLGPTGSTGSKGDKGDQGNNGSSSDGEDGEDGDVGATGATGAGSSGDSMFQEENNLVFPGPVVSRSLALGSTLGNDQTTTSTSSALVYLDGTTGDASLSGTLTVGQGESIRSQYGPLQLDYKSGPDAYSSAMFIQDGTGNVGIGTTNPVAKLNAVSTTEQLRLNYDSTHYSSFTVDSGGGLKIDTSARGISIGDSSTLDADAYSLGNSNTISGKRSIAIGTNVGTISSDDVISIGDSNDRIGINTTSPAARLDVQGGYAGNSAMLVNQTLSGDIFTASASGSPKFTIKNSGYVGIGTTNPSTNFHLVGNATLDGAQHLLQSDSNIALQLYNGTNSLWYYMTQNAGGDLYFQSHDSSNRFQLNQNGNVGINTTSPASRLDVQGGYAGNAAMRVNQTNSGDIFTASSSGTPRFTIANSGNVGIGTVLPASPLDIVDTAITTGKGINLSSTSTTFSTGQLMSIDWSPGSSTTATGDLLKINVGSNGTVGKLLNILDNGSTLFSVSETQIVSGVPHLFSSPGDVTMAYDLLFTNQTASYIRSLGPLTIDSGESFESNDLTLTTHNYGNIYLNPSQNGATVLGEASGSSSLKTNIAAYSESSGAAMIENLASNANADGLVVKLGFTGTGSTTNSFATFLNGNGDIHGKIMSNASSGVTYQTTGVDFAEFFKKQNPDEVIAIGTIVCQGTSGVKPCTGQTDASKFVGIVSGAPAVLGGKEGPDRVIVGLVGQLPVLIDPTSEPIAYGDFLTLTTNGKAKKATTPGFMIGRALEHSEGKTSVNVFILNVWSDPMGSLAFDTEGELNISAISAFQELQSQTTTLNNTVTSLTNRLTTLESQNATQSATPSETTDQLTTLTDRLDFLELLLTGDNASSSSSLAIATTSGQLATSSASTTTLTNNLSVLGTTTTGPLSVAGQSLFDGSLIISAGGISSLDGLLTFMNGSVTISQLGNIQTQGSITADSISANVFKTTSQSSGTATIEQLTSSISITSPSVATNSMMFVSPTSPLTGTLYISEKRTGSFDVTLTQQQLTPVTFDWWVIGKEEE